MGDFLIIPCVNCIKITQKQAWRPLIYFAWMKSMYFREYVCRFSRKLHYFCILGVSHLNVFWNNFFSSQWGLGDFLIWWPPSTMWADPLIYLWPSTGDVWIIPSLWIWDYVLHVEYVSCVITNCGQHQWAIPSPLNSSLGIAGGKHNQKLLSLSLDLFFEILLFHVAFLIFFSITIFSPYFFLLGFLLQCVALFQSRELGNCLE